MLPLPAEPIPHRQLAEFQTFVRQVWRKRGAATQRNWQARIRESWAQSLARRVFGWFDRESRARRPRPRDLSRALARRTAELFAEPGG